MTPSRNEELDGTMEPAGWSDLESSLLRSGRTDPPRSTERAVLTALGLELPGPGGPGGESLPPPATSPAPFASAGGLVGGAAGGFAVAKWGALAVLVVAVPVGWMLVGRARPSVLPAEPVAVQQTPHETTPVPTPSPAAPEKRALGLDELPSEAPRAAHAREGAAVAPSDAAVQLDESPVGSSLAAELALIRRARSALGTGNAAEALGLLAEYQTSFSAPQLGSEALVVRVEALLRLGRKEEARRLAAPLLTGDSLYAQRLRALVQ